MHSTTVTPAQTPSPGAAATRPSGAWERILMRALYDPFLWTAEHAGMARRRRRLLARAEGRVLEIGAGTGLNARHYPDTVDDLVVTEPVAEVIPRIERRLRRARRRAQVVAAPAEDLPLPDGSADTVVSTMVLCTVDDVAATLAELRRVLAPGGRLLLMEHVRADGGWRERAQDVVFAGWRRFAAGCRCNQATLELVERAGFEVTEIERTRWRGMPFCVTPLILATATPR